MSLPVCSVQHPSCGACGGETRWDEYFFCEDCGLNYGDGEDQTEAEFSDEEATACENPCENHWHGPHKIRQGWTYSCRPCALPAGHASDHWTDCQLTEVEKTP